MAGASRELPRGLRLASIDLGTNTVRLLVAEVAEAAAWRVVEQDQRVTRLGEGLSASGRLGEGPMARTMATVGEYVERAARAGARAIGLVATSAVREASNGAEFATELERTTGVAVRIVSGREEAQLTVRGIVAGLGLVRGPVLAFDIGGGSTEFMLARDGRLQEAASLRMGVVPLAERYPFPGPVDRARYVEMEREIRRRLTAELPPTMRGTGMDAVVGTAGTVTTLAALDLALPAYEVARVQGHRLERGAIERLRDRLAGLTVAQRAALPCLEPGRADLIVPGLAIVLATLDVTGARAVVVSDWGLREGIMAEAIERWR